MNDFGRGRLFLLVGAMLAAHFLFRPVLGGWPVAPDLLTGGVLLAALRLRPGAAAALGFAGGLLEAAVALVGLGHTALVYTGLGYLTSRWRELFFADIPAFVFVYLFVGCWIAELLLAGVTDAGLSVGFIAGRAPAVAIVTAVVCGACERLLAPTPA